MITCKEDLMNTYIRNDNGELLELYIASCLEFGFHLSPAFNGSKLLDDEFMFIATGIDGDSVWAVNNRYDAMTSQLTISDLKPKQCKPTKFVKVEESIFDLKGEFERGELYFSEWGEEKSFAKIKKEHRLMNNLNSGNVYRQVEIDWRDEVKKLDKSAIFHDGGDLFLIIDSNSNDFISMCHEIASLTEKPEGV
ncbi:hypothetical protein NVP1286O_14 [Vibrio phage 1.286.O._10N.286.55.C4]|nr:hypothetical protein NVP1286O_14 [Vibrio phage 1.286.O._10N.286.55.C4]